MRPRKEVLLVTANEEELGVWRLRIETRGGYRVHGYTTAIEALAHLDQAPVFAAITSLPSAAKALETRMDEVLLFGGKFSPKYLKVVAFEPEGNDLTARVLWRLKLMCARKRGPLRGADALRAKALNATALKAVEAAKKPVQPVALAAAAEEKRRA